MLGGVEVEERPLRLRILTLKIHLTLGLLTHASAQSWITKPVDVCTRFGATADLETLCKYMLGFVGDKWIAAVYCTKIRPRIERLDRGA